MPPSGTAGWNNPGYSNPGFTNPAPSPDLVPRPLWSGPKTPVKWSLSATITPASLSPLPPGVLYSFGWSSPVFDLRPDLRSSTGAPATGVPLWSTATRLYVSLTTNSQGSGELPPINTSNLVVEATDWTSVDNNYQTKSIPNEGITGGAGLYRGTVVDVSSKFTSGGGTTVLVGFSPPGTVLGGGDGYPIRYWRLSLAFSQNIETGVPVPDPPPPGSAMVLTAYTY